MARVETFEAFWLNRNCEDLARISTVETGAGRLEFNTNAESKIGGSLHVWDVPSWVNPLKHRVRVQATIDGTLMPLGVFLVDMEDQKFTTRTSVREVTLLDQLQVPVQDELVGPYALGVGHNIVSAVKTILAGMGETRLAVTQSDAVLATPQVWEPGTPLLKVINDLLAIAGYWGLRTDPNGYFVLAPYILPEYRPLARTFVAGDGSLMKADYSKQNNYSGIPNRFIAFSPEYDTDETKSEKVGFQGLVGVADLTNPASPYSFVNRGRWIAKSEQVEAATQKEIDLIAQRKLSGFLNPAVNISVEHALFPGLWLDKAVRVVPSNGEPFTGTVTEMTIPLKAGGLVTGKWREVVSLA